VAALQDRASDRTRVGPPQAAPDPGERLRVQLFARLAEWPLERLRTDLLDLLDARHKGKAVRWLGGPKSRRRREKFKLYALLGLPSDDRLRPACIKAQNIMHKMNVPHDFVREDKAADLARSVAIESYSLPSRRTSLLNSWTPYLGDLAS